MRVLLINPIMYPSIEQFVEDSKRQKINADEPIGVMYIASYIKQQLPEVEIEVFDWHLECLKYIYNDRKETFISFNYDLSKDDKIEILKDKLIEKIKISNPDIIGISALYEMNLNISLEVARIVKEINNDIITVMGGICASYQDKFDNVDYTIEGEGEKPFLYLCKDLYEKRELKKQYNNSKIAIRNINKLSYPDRSNIDVGMYSIYGRTVVDRVYKENCRVATVQISRGCSCMCNYCTGHLISQRNYRTRDIDSIIDEIKQLKEKYNIEVFQFSEENPNINIKHTKKLYRELIKLDIKWISNSGFYVHNIDKEFVELAMKSGLLYWNLAIESGSKRIMKLTKKSEKIVDNVKNVVQWIREVDNCSYILGFWMFGFPFETLEYIDMSIELARELDLEWNQINMLQIFRGSELWDYCESRNLLDNQDNNETQYISSRVKNENGLDYFYINKYIYQKMNLDLNFHKNRCMRVGRYDQAMRDFQHVINVTNGEHEEAKKYLEVCYEKNNN